MSSLDPLSAVVLLLFSIFGTNWFMYILAKSKVKVVSVKYLFIRLYMCFQFSVCVLNAPYLSCQFYHINSIWHYVSCDTFSIFCVNHFIATSYHSTFVSYLLLSICVIRGTFVLYLLIHRIIYTFDSIQNMIFPTTNQFLFSYVTISPHQPVEP